MPAVLLSLNAFACTQPRGKRRGDTRQQGTDSSQQPAQEGEQLRTKQGLCIEHRISMAKFCARHICLRDDLEYDASHFARTKGMRTLVPG